MVDSKGKGTGRSWVLSIVFEKQQDDSVAGGPRCQSSKAMMQRERKSQQSLIKVKDFMEEQRTCFKVITGQGDPTGGCRARFTHLTDKDFAQSISGLRSVHQNFSDTCIPVPSQGAHLDLRAQSRVPGGPGAGRAPAGAPGDQGSQHSGERPQHGGGRYMGGQGAGRGSGPRAPPTGSYAAAAPGQRGREGGERRRDLWTHPFVFQKRKPRSATGKASPKGRPGLGSGSDPALAGVQSLAAGSQAPQARFRCLTGCTLPRLLQQHEFKASEGLP
uniref:Uncharacterized protein LOC110209220 n=1 Tax=Phascolarctos cinereus TaxID=38626 RepID=A0A6P5KDW4_PHACI|nr:uncharacterized protein LOC110209220 [Phascolarctos cinereus]